MTEALDKVEAKLTRYSTAITKHELMTAWANGIFNDQAYIYLALLIENVKASETFDIDCFIARWEAPKPDSEKMKVLKTATVLSVLGKLAQKDVLEMTTQLQIGLF
jgi:hypothetical protein